MWAVLTEMVPDSRIQAKEEMMGEHREGPLPGDKAHAEHKGKSIPVFDFEKLSGNELVVLIRLGNEVYELRKTKTGKLVLNK